MKTRRRILVIIVMFCSQCWFVQSQPINALASTDSLQRVFAQAYSTLSSPKLEERKTLVREFQQRGYASTLSDVLDLNGLSAILSYLKVRLQIEFSIPHELISVDITSPPLPRTPKDSLHVSSKKNFTIILPAAPHQRMRVGLDIDWTFPSDPWSTE